MFANSAARRVLLLRSKTELQLVTNMNRALNTTLGKSRKDIFHSVCGKRHMSGASTQDSVKATVAVPIGLVSGSLSALTGVGGGVIIIPALRNLSPLTQQACNATSLLAVTFSGAVGSASYIMAGLPNVPLALTFAGVSLITVRYGVRAANSLSNKNLTKVMAVALALIAPVIAFKPTPAGPVEGELQSIQIPEWLDALPLSRRMKEDAMEVVLHPVKYIGAGLASGFVSGLLGVGGGVLMSSFLSSTTDLPQATVVATSLLSVVPVGLAGTYHNYRYGNVQFRVAGLIAGSAMGAVLATSTLVKDGQFTDRGKKVFLEGSEEIPTDSARAVYREHSAAQAPGTSGRRPLTLKTSDVFSAIGHTSD